MEKGCSHTARIRDRDRYEIPTFKGVAQTNIVKYDTFGQTQAGPKWQEVYPWLDYKSEKVYPCYRDTSPGTSNMEETPVHCHNKKQKYSDLTLCAF